MSARARAALALAATLLLGMLLGVLLGGFVQQLREGVLAGARGRGGFVDHMMQIIEPHDEAQEAQLRPLLRGVEDRNEEIARRAGDDMRAALDQLLIDLEPLLDDEQMERMRDFARRPDGGPGGRPGGPGRPPPRDKRGGRRPPPPR